MPSIQTVLDSPTLLAVTPEIGAPLTERGQRILDNHVRYEVFHKALVNVPIEAARFMDAVLDYAEPHWLSLLGPSGVGKTMINRQICRLLGKWWKVKTPTGRRGPWIAELVPGKDLSDYKAPSEYADADLVFIEDIGAGVGLGEKGPGAVIRSRVVELLQYRAKKWTILDANLYRSEIAEKLDPRIASRLKRDGSVMIEIPSEVPDYNG